MANYCKICKKELLPDEIGAHRKLINRGDTEFMCIPCLAKNFKVDTQVILNMVEEFRASGCGLFAQKR